MLLLTFSKECCLNRSATPTWFVYSVGGWIRTTVLTFKVIVSILRILPDNPVLISRFVTEHAKTGKKSLLPRNYVVGHLGIFCFQLLMECPCFFPRLAVTTRGPVTP